MSAHPQRIPSLDGLRAFSIALVLVSHLAGTRHFPMSFETANVLFLGDLGVHVFFVISGFLITGLLLGELDSRRRIDLPRFYLRRTLRIFPPYYTLIFLLMFADAMGWLRLGPRDAAHALTYTSNYQSDGSWFLGHTWSLSVEEQFYLLWPAVMVLAGRRRSIAIAAGAVLLAPVVRLVVFQVFHANVEHRFETVADAIAVGCVLAGVRQWLHARPAYVRVLRSHAFAVVPVLTLAANLLHANTRTYLGVGLTVENVGIALCIDWCVSHASGRVGRVLNAPAVVFVGVMSYSVYLWQQVFLNRASTALSSGFPMNVALTVLAALVSYYIVERPSLRLRRRIESALDARQQRGAVAALKAQPIA